MSLSDLLNSNANKATYGAAVGTLAAAITTLIVFWIQGGELTPAVEAALGVVVAFVLYGVQWAVIYYTRNKPIEEDEPITGESRPGADTVDLTRR